MVFVVLCPGAPKGPTGSGSDFKAPQKTGLQLKRMFMTSMSFVFVENFKLI